MNISLKRLGNLIATIFFGWVSLSTIQGNLQETIHFAGIANEIGFFFCTTILTTVFGFLTISK